MQKNPKLNVARYKVDGGEINQYEFQQNQEIFAQQREFDDDAMMPGTPPEETLQAQTHPASSDMVDELVSGIESKAPATTTKKAVARKATKKAGKKATKKAAKKATKKAGKKSTKKAAKRSGASKGRASKKGKKGTKKRGTKRAGKKGTKKRS